MANPSSDSSGKPPAGFSYPLFVRHDLDGFFGLFIDNLVQLLLILGLCAGLCGMSGEGGFLLAKYVLPGAAVSILAGNLFYAWQARRLAFKTHDPTVTALPYGINTPSLLVYVFFVMAPVFAQQKGAGASAVEAATKAWEFGLLACFGSGVIELCGALVAGAVRRATPRAALLSTLAGIAIGFISMSFALQIFQQPLVAMLPLGVVLVTYFSGIRFPLGLPGGLIAVVIGTIVAWGLALCAPWLPASLQGPPLSVAAISQAASQAGWYPPQFTGDRLWALLQNPTAWLSYLSVIVPMGLFNLVGSLQNIESAEASGDRYSTMPSLAINGLGTLLASIFGSCFPTTIYIGHPGWKELGARAGYSTLNGLVVTLLCLTGTVPVIQAIVPIEAGVAIVLWIGIIMTAQAFSASGVKHAPAVAVGLFPAIAAFAFTVAQGSLIVAGGKSLQDLLATNMGMQVNGFLLHGMLTIERGYIFSCMILAGMSATLIDRQFGRGALWALAGMICAGIGLTHAYQLSGNDVDFLFAFSRAKSPEALVFRAEGIAVGYGLIMLLLWLLAWMNKPSADNAQPKEHRH